MVGFSEVIGKLSKIRVAEVGEVSNVYLTWKGVNEVKEDQSFCQYLRILVLATRHIMLFGQFIRPPSRADVVSRLGKPKTDKLTRRRLRSHIIDFTSIQIASSFLRFRIVEFEPTYLRRLGLVCVRDI